MTKLPATLLSINSVWFAVLHVLWALGWRWGIPASMPSVSERPLFLVYDLVAAVLMVFLAVVAAIVARQPAMLDRRLWRGFLVLTAVVCGLRALLGIVGDVSALRNGTLTAVSALADAWFLVTAVLAAGAVLTRPKR